MRFSDLVAFAVLLEASSFFSIAHWMTSQYLKLHATWQQAVVAGGPDWVKGLLLVAAAALYWRVAQARPWLRILAIVGAIDGTYTFLLAQHIVRSYWSVFEGDIVAISVVSSLGLLVIGILAAADHYIEKSQRRHMQ